MSQGVEALPNHKKWFRTHAIDQKGLELAWTSVLVEIASIPTIINPSIASPQTPLYHQPFAHTTEASLHNFLGPQNQSSRETIVTCNLPEENI